MGGTGLSYSFTGLPFPSSLPVNCQFRIVNFELFLSVSPSSLPFIDLQYHLPSRLIRIDVFISRFFIRLPQFSRAKFNPLSFFSTFHISFSFSTTWTLQQTVHCNASEFHTFTLLFLFARLQILTNLKVLFTPFYICKSCFFVEKIYNWNTCKIFFSLFC